MRMKELWCRQQELHAIAEEFGMHFNHGLNTWTLIEEMQKEHKNQIRRMRRMSSSQEEIQEFHDAFAQKMAAFDIQVPEV